MNDNDNTSDTNVSPETTRYDDSYTATKTDTSFSATTKKASSSQPTKLVDLGAAATFANQAAAAAAESQRKEMTNSTIDSVFGDFPSQSAPLPSTQGTTSGQISHTFYVTCVIEEAYVCRRWIC